MNDQVSAQKYTILVTFQWGQTPSIARYCRWTNDITVGGATYLSEMTLDVKPGENHGGVEDKPWTVTMPARLPLDKLIRPYVWAPVTCTVEEMDPGDDTSRRVIWRGNVSKTIKNAAGFKRLVRAEVSGFKSLLQYPLGIQANQTCAWNLGDKNCCVNLTDKRVEATIESIENGTTLIVPTIAVPPGDANYWSFGEARIDGLGVTILDGSQGSGKLVLLELPPPEWIGSLALFTPGCDKLIPTCRKRWNNEQRFGGFGVSIPDYNPLIGSAT